MPSASSVCRVCLAGNIRMLHIDNMHLSQLFEKITYLKLNSESDAGMPSTVCYVCHQLLQRCLRFSNMARRSDRSMRDMLRNGVEITCSTITMLPSLAITPRLSVAHTLHMSVTDHPNVTNTAATVKEEQVVKIEETGESEETGLEESHATSDEGGEGSASIVHRHWLTPMKCQVFWPPVKESKAVNRLIVDHAKPDDTWKLYGIRRVFYETDCIEKAKEKLAELNPDLQTEAEDTVKQQRSKRRTKRYNITLSDDEDIDSHKRPPPLKKQYIDGFKEINEPGALGVKEIEAQKEYRSKAIPTDYSSDDTSTDVVAAYSSTPKIAGTNNDNSYFPNTFSSSILQNIEQDFLTSDQRRSDIFHEKVITLLTHIKCQNDQILSILKSTDGTLKVDFKLPITTIEVLETTEGLLKNQENYDNLVQYIKSIGGRDIFSKVSRILKTLLCDSLAKQFNFYGKRSQKKPFCQLRLRNCVVEAVKRSAVGTTEKDIEDCIKTWLKHAPERHRKSENKAGNINVSN